MKCCVIANERAEHQKSWGGAFAAGMRRHGWGVVVNQPGSEDLLVKWSVRDVMGHAKRAKARGAQVVILERGYLGDRMHEWTSVSLGGELNGRARFGPCRDNGERFRSIASLAPWQDGNRAIILGQCPGDMSVQGWNVVDTYLATNDELVQRGWDVLYRPHPVDPVLVPGVPMQDPKEVPIEAAFEGCGLAFTISSNSAVDALLAGVPTVAVDDRSMAWEVTTRGLDPIQIPREKWAHHLAWKQWRRSEIEAGDAWAALMEAA